MQRRVNQASQEASAQTAGHRGRDIRPHGHIQALQGQIGGQVSRQAGGQGGHKQPLDEPGPHQEGEAGGGGAKKAAGRHHPAPHQDKPLHREAVRQHAEGQVGQGDSQNHRGDGVRGLGRVDPELLLQDGQHRLGDVHRSEGCGHQAEDQSLECEKGLPVHRVSVDKQGVPKPGFSTGGSARRYLCATSISYYTPLAQKG